MNEAKYTTLTEISLFNDLLSFIEKDPFDHWVFRGQDSSHELVTSLERECKKSNISLSDAPAIEQEMTRNFQRIYDGFSSEIVQRDTLYCLTLMRHYGAPTRLIDFTYSKYVAVYFALKCAYNNVPQKSVANSSRLNHEPDYNAERTCSIWCVNTKELMDQVKSKYNEKVRSLIEKRHSDDTRNDSSFKQLYFNNKYILALGEGSVQQHKRIHVQQGLVLCPGDVRKTFMENLLYPFDVNTDKVLKLNCSFKPSELQKGFETLMRMNITDESLFPGLDGLAQSMSYNIWFYKKMSEWRKQTR